MAYRRAKNEVAKPTRDKVSNMLKTISDQYGFSKPHITACDFDFSRQVVHTNVKFDTLEGYSNFVRVYIPLNKLEAGDYADVAAWLAQNDAIPIAEPL